MATICTFINSCKKRAGFAALVALIAAVPAWARVDISCAQVGETYEVIISFDASSETNLIRAFSFDIQLDNDANITEVIGLSADYYIYPGTIQIDAFGNVIDYGTALAEYGDLPSDTLLGIDSNGITIEMASLYAPVGLGSPNAPAKSGDLVSLKFSRDTCLTISANVARTGGPGVVMEDPNEIVEVNLPGLFCVGYIHPCYENQPDYDDWLRFGSPECWCYPRQCYGDTDDQMGGSSKTGFYAVGPLDLNILISAWLVREPPSGPGIDTIPNGICADFAHDEGGSPKTGYYRVGPTDLNILITNWLVLEPFFGPGIPPNCLDRVGPW
ncbi:MAG: hypothetical protein ACYSWZ_18105 [Planctomycetota bacterium]